MKTRSDKLFFYVSVLLFLALFAGLAVPMQTVRAADVCVESSGAGGCYTTIQAAIDAASAGDTINVAAGTYAGQIIVNKSVTILGDPGDASAGPGPGAPVIDGGSLPGDAFLLANGVSNVKIQGFEMRNFTSPSMDGIGNGISAWEASTSNITIQDNYFHHLGYNGVLVGNDGAAGDHTNWLIKSNIIENFGYIGFELTNTSNSSIEDNVIHMATPFIGAIFSSARRSESGLTVKNNQIDGTPSTSYPVIYFYAYDLDLPNPNLDSVLIEGNTISTTGTPFQVYVRNVGTGTVTNVQVHKNNLTSLKNLTAATIDATANWWGAVTGPNVGKISGSVDYDPWYLDAEMTILSDSVPTTAYIDATYTSGSAGGHIFEYDAFATIQEGITAVAEGGTVNVAAGTYTEQVNITKSLHLIGAGVGSSVIAAPATLPASGNATSSIILIGGSGVGAELTGFTVAGPGPSGCGSIRTGIYVYDGANANIHHNTIQDIRDSALSGCQNGVAIAVGRQAWATTGTATIDHNTIIGYQKGGILVDNTGSNATITNNIVTGSGTTDVIAQNGIQISRGANATLSGNTVTGNSFHLDGSAWDWGSTGILFYQAGSVTLSGGNTVSGNDQNLYIDSATAVTFGSETIGSSTAPINYGYDVINFTALNLNLTSVTFMGSVNNFEIEDRIWHGGDEATSGLVTWVAGNLYVTPLSGVGAIQRAINAATPGDVINVAAGTYVENITIPKSITLKGVQFGANVGGRAAASLGESTIQGLVTVNASDINVNGFTLTNPGQTYAMSITPSSGNIVIVYNIVDTVGAVGLAQNVHSIVLQNGADLVTIAHNRFNNIKAGAKSVSAIGVLDTASINTSTGLLIQDNTFTNIASGTKGAYGIILNNAAGVPGAQIKDNTFSGLSGGWTHAIGMEGPTPNAVVTGNIFSGLIAAGADNAAILFEKNPVGNTVTISKNQFNGTAFYGVAVHPNDLPFGYIVVAENNWWNAMTGPAAIGLGAGAFVGPNVDYSPWCVDAACTAFAPPFATTTTITADAPDPSLPGQIVSVAATVASLPAGAPTPTGTVTISGGVTNCTIALVSGAGSCDITFTTGSAQTITATYNATADFSTSSDTESHTVQLTPFLLTPLDGEILHNNRPTFDWVDYPGATGYQIQVSHNSNFEHRIVDTKTSATKSYYTVDENLPKNDTVYWRVRAKLGNTYTAWSEVRSLQTANPPSTPELHSPSNNALLTDLTPLFDWERSRSSAFDHYQIQVDDNADFSSPVIDADVSGASNHTYASPTDLVPNTKYYWHVRAWNTAGDYSKWSTVRSFREALLSPEPVTPVGGVTVGSRKPVFDWNDVTGATGYTLQVSLNRSFKSLVLNINVSSSIYTPTVNLSAHKLFYWRVRANGSNGSSDWSAVDTFRTP